MDTDLLPSARCERMVNVSQGAIALGVLTLLFGGDLYSMFGQPAEVDRMALAIG